MQVRVFNYNTLERVHAFEAHSDYVRCIAVHPTQPYILTSSGKLRCCKSELASSVTVVVHLPFMTFVNGISDGCVPGFGFLVQSLNACRNMS
jgi:WD40 repeat protein